MARVVWPVPYTTPAAPPGTQQPHAARGKMTTTQGCFLSPNAFAFLALRCLVCKWTSCTSSVQRQQRAPGVCSNIFHL